MANEDQKINDNPIELRSREIDAILGRTPNSLVRNGIMVIFGVMLLIFCGAFFFSCPDAIHCRMVITSSNPPVHVIAQTSGRIRQLPVTDRQKVSAGQLLAVMENPADINDILMLEALVDSIRKNGIGAAGQFSLAYRHLDLGVVTPYYLEFRKALNEHNRQNRQLTDNIYHTLEVLNYQLAVWKKNHILHSPVEGIVSFANVWAANQSVTAGDLVMSILPVHVENIIGKMEIPVAGSGKIRPGQKVIIKPDNYPYMEFGVIKGVITSVSLIPVMDMYIADIELPDGLRSNYGNSIPFSQEMGATADIILEDMSLFERLLQPVRSAIKRK